MAAQSLVRRSFAEPRETYETNVMGTVNVLDAVRVACGDVRAVVNVTSDKCYENREWEWGYREDEPMGGHDPYSSSKGCAELVDERLPPLVLLRAADGPRLASARAGNVIGGGDWGEDRLVPGHHARGARRRAGAGAQPQLDPPLAARAQPAQRLSGARPGAVGVARARERAGTSGPAEEDARPVGWIVERLAELWPRRAALGARRRPASARGPLPEARLLAGALAARLAPARGPRGRRSRASSTGTARCATARTCARSRSGRSRRFQYAAAPRHEPDRLPILRCSRGGRVRRPRHVAAGELLSAARAGRTAWSRSIRCARSSAAAASWSSSRSSRRPSGSSPTTPTSPPTPRAGSSTAAAMPSR